MFESIRNFFWFCAGVNRRILLECETESSKYFAIGATVFFTACFASLSGAYALYFVFSGSSYAIWASLGFGILWGLTIFNIDRFLVISIKKENNPRREFFQAIPRIFLAIMIGIVIARPLELKIFDKEIKEGLKQYYLENQEQLVKSKNDKFDEQFISITTQLSQKRNERDSAYKNWQNEKDLRDIERFGTKTIRTSGQVGWGPNTDKLQKEVDLKQSIYDTLSLQVSELERLLSTKRTNAGLNEVTFVNDASLDSIVNNAGFYDRNKILGQISAWVPWGFLFKNDESSKAVTNLDTLNTINTSNPAPKERVTIQRLDGENDKTGFFISVLFIIIELLPIIVKLMSRRGVYDIKLDEEEERLNFLSRHETYANKHLIQQLAISQREVLTKAIDQWEKDEIKSNTLGSKYINTDRNE